MWGVQLAAGFSRDKALAMYPRTKRLSAVIGDQDPSLLSSVMRSRGTRAFYQVRIGADTRPAADDLCNRIRKAGGACFVLKNRGVPGGEGNCSPDERSDIRDCNHGLFFCGSGLLAYSVPRLVAIELTASTVGSAWNCGASCSNGFYVQWEPGAVVIAGFRSE